MHLLELRLVNQTVSSVTVAFSDDFALGANYRPV